jgi:membrane-associated phospholipid phosphatase
MRPFHALWIGLFVIAILVTVEARYYLSFPGDVWLEKGVQSLLPGNLNWAELVSKTAEFPWFLFILTLILALSWIIGGWRASLLSILSFAGMWALGNLLGPLIARPRPSPELVHVFRPLPGYSFPSLFALRYAATFGFLAVLAVVKTSGVRRAVLVILCCVLLILGWIARVALAAHWPSDVIISYYWGVLWAAFLIRFTLFKLPARR